MFTTAQALIAIKARVNGEWDNPELLKLEYVTELRTDILLIIENISPERKPDVTSDEEWLKENPDFCEDDLDNSHLDSEGRTFRAMQGGTDGG